MEDIYDYWSDGKAINVYDGFIIILGGGEIQRKQRMGRSYSPKFNKGFQSGLQNNPVELAQYAVAKKIDRNPDFAWRVPFTLRKCNRIVSKLQKKCWRTTHKFGILVLKLVKRAN